ncbi:DUF547 domain-containing protein [Flavimarina sp. Hel_I_48]|uniref:DUF547 domain-containing protein n=1 Tax=Flavimarina sp. Hel_I_48 TaxID=1392488 RepID=UPI0004DF3A4B|nr:DUF547 domain-containing protein [Flavimarina sp. Hel_I_48]
MKVYIRLLLLLLIAHSAVSCHLLTAAGLGSQGQPTKKTPDKLTSMTTNSEVNVDHSGWDALLKKHVNAAGYLDYKGFEKDRPALDAYMKKLSSLEPDKNWSVQELLAYYINLYNVYTVDLILKNYPLKSIQDIDGAFTKAFIPIGKHTLSLGGLENGVLRKMNEPRIHFAINCASVSCPKLSRDAYTAAKINEQLEEAVKGFINSEKNDITADNPKISAIFKFYTKDFITDETPSLNAYINQFSDTKINLDAPIVFKEYNWSLNEQ